MSRSDTQTATKIFDIRMRGCMRSRAELVESYLQELKATSHLNRICFCTLPKTITNLNAHVNAHVLICVLRSLSTKWLVHSPYWFPSCTLIARIECCKVKSLSSKHGDLPRGFRKMRERSTPGRSRSGVKLARVMQLTF